jgi:D-glycero-D-manno-heptose 1,7-bisphosphate phosphatase
MRADGVFLDKDGTLLINEPYNVDPQRMRVAPGASEMLAVLAQLDLQLFVVGNQPGVALGFFAEEALEGVVATLRALFEINGARLAGCYFCPHDRDGTIARYSLPCLCRKPLPGLLRRAAAEHGIDLRRSWMVGDVLDDVEAGHRAGCRTILIHCGNETQWRVTSRTAALRTPDFIVHDAARAATIIAGAFVPRVDDGGSLDR